MVREQKLILIVQYESIYDFSLKILDFNGCFKFSDNVLKLNPYKVMLTDWVNYFNLKKLKNLKQ